MSPQLSSMDDLPKLIDIGCLRKGNFIFIMHRYQEWLFKNRFV
jgi:hypothetical protein